MKSPKIIGIQRELEPLHRSGIKYAAYIVEGEELFPLYLAAESVEELQARVRAIEPVREWHHLYRIADYIQPEGSPDPLRKLTDDAFPSFDLR